jgi:hypothetical protein
VGLAVLGAIVGPTETGESKPEAIRAAPNSRTNPVPLGKRGGAGEHWTLKVVSVTPNATRRVLAATGKWATRPPAAAQDFMVFISATYRGGGKANLFDLADRLNVVGVHNAPYSLTVGNACGPGRAKLPSPDLQTRFDHYEAVFSGQTVRGNICFQIAKNDARSLILYVAVPFNGAKRPAWFALRRR